MSNFTTFFRRSTVYEYMLYRATTNLLAISCRYELKARMKWNIYAKSCCAAATAKPNLSRFHIFGHSRPIARNTLSFVCQNELLIFAWNNCSCKCTWNCPLPFIFLSFALNAYNKIFAALSAHNECSWIITTNFCIEHLNWTHTNCMQSICVLRTYKHERIIGYSSCFTRLRRKFMASWWRHCVFFVFSETNSKEIWMNARGLCWQYEMHGVQGINWQIDSAKITFFRQNNFSMIFFSLLSCKSNSPLF